MNVASSAITFTIENNGNANLTISDVALSGADANQFTLNKSKTTSQIVAGGTTSFTVSFYPKNNTPSIKSASIIITNNDSDEGTYIINLTATAVILPATITSIDPNTGAGIGATVTITGTNLINTTEVTFNGVPASFTINSNTKITAPVPVGATTGLLSITNPVGTITSAQSYNIIPKITGFNPNIAAIGSTVVITGTSFTGATAVTFNGVEAASFIVNSDTQISAVVPANTSTGFISVTTPSGTGTSTSSFSPSPVITSIVGPGGDNSAVIGNTVIINGTSFTSAATVKFVDKNGATITAPKTYINNTQINAVVPFGAVSGQVTVTTSAATASANITIINTTYTWNSKNGEWNNANNWTPARTNPTANDILMFDGKITGTTTGAATVSLNFTSPETIGYLGLINDANVTFSVATDKILNIDNNVSEKEDLFIESGAKLFFTNSTAGADLMINLLPGETGIIAGGLEFNGTGAAEHRLIANNRANNGNTLIFQSSSTFSAKGNFTGSPFGSEFNNSVQFSSNAKYYNQSPAAGSPFGNSSSSTVVVFDPNTLYRHDIDKPLDLLNRTYGTIEINNVAFNQTVIGIGNLTIQKDLILTNATTFNLNLIGNITIGRNITITKGSLNFNPASATTIRLDGTGATGKNGAIQQSSGATGGSINLGPNAHMIVETDAIITVTKTVAGTGRVTINGTLRSGSANTVGISGSATTPFASTLQPLSFNPGSTVEYNGTGSQTISGENYANLTISGVRTAEAIITLPNALRVSGTFTIAPTGIAPTFDMNTNNNTIEFNGNNQIIPAFNYKNLVISGTADKVLEANVSITGNLSMVANNINTNGHFLILGETATITGEASGRYVVGNLSTLRNITSALGSDFGGMGITIGLGPLGSQNLGLTTVNRITGPGANVIVEGRRGINRRWEVLPTNQPTEPINVTLSWVADDDNGKDLTKARVWKTKGDDATTFYDVSTSNQNVAKDRTITATVSSFSIFTVSDQNNPLPVELMAFEVTKKGSTALLTWQTATEQNNQGFAVEISTDARLYKEVGFVESQNSNSSAVQNYTFTHRIGQAGTFYYRLKQTDWNGTTKYFGPKALTFDQVIPALSVYPNPVTSNTPALSVLIGSSEPESATITITDVLGKVVYSKNILVGPTHNEVKVDLRNQATGVYIIRVISPSTGTNQIRIVKQ
ncbi:T9SS type A sorting domain-containing protein [Adhaeribacter swui]|uniref:T9SS type A sorting domain-containing protein n=1 Tax=Adhaeribacter swui TaxID=2086471 RepID=A0A7G7G616_9BACT|nr:T9SS type A sorting domain-containing protein [Adhaeribacter swui]QNF32600.1 T9SS type A sorting domain-containing protein [Adhaeribacter swui]